MRVLTLLLAFVLAGVIGCTTEAPTAYDDAAINLTEQSAMAKSENAASVIRYEDLFILWTVDPATGKEIDFFDPVAFCEDGFPEGFDRMSIKDVIKDAAAECDPGAAQGEENCRIHRLVKGDNVATVALPEFWDTCDQVLDWRDNGLLETGTSKLQSNDNDVFGPRDRRNTNTWTMQAQGKLMTFEGEVKNLNFHQHCVWNDETDFDDVRCKTQVRYH